MPIFIYISIGYQIKISEILMLYPDILDFSRWLNSTLWHRRV